MRKPTTPAVSRALLPLLLVLISASDFTTADTAPKPSFSPIDVFEIEWAQNPQISPNGEQVLYRRMGFDTMRDARHGNLWLAASDGSSRLKLTSFEGNESKAVWSPDAKAIAYLRETDDGLSTDIYRFSIANGQSTRVTHVEGKPAELSFSPDGSLIVYSMTVKQKLLQLGTRPEKPALAEWAESPRVTDRLYHEKDGSGYIQAGFSHVFIVPSEGGLSRQLTEGDFHHRQPSWHPDGTQIFVSGNRSTDWEYDFRNSELYAVDVGTSDVQQITNERGPDSNPMPSPNGKHLAWLGYADKNQAYQLTRLRVARKERSERIELLPALDRSISAFQWAPDSSGLYVQYDDHGRTKIGFAGLDGAFREIADNLGGTSIGRPYAGGSFSVSSDLRIAYTYTRPEFPADIAVVSEGSVKTITQLNDDLLDARELGATQEIRWKSSFDQREIQGWILTPPGFDSTQKYPLLVENHGGPISNYGERFSPEMQLYAAADYVVFFPNARGSTGYGEEFGNLLYHNYPGQDYDDVMSGVDAVLAMGFVDPKQLYVTGGSAGGIMTAWMIGKNDRFRAAAVVKPVMNWYSKTLNADNWFRYYHSRIPGTPWTNPEDYMRFSPISLVGNVSTPTLVMVGLSDLRTPPSQAKQLYHALKYRRVPTTLVELPGASHFIAKRPSQLIDKISAILAWFERYADD